MRLKKYLQTCISFDEPTWKQLHQVADEGSTSLSSVVRMLLQQEAARRERLLEREKEELAA